jgi:hypothetical protein
LWLDDIFYHAWMASLFSPEIARENLAAVYQTRKATAICPA